jgi:hypothetical protein
MPSLIPEKGTEPWASLQECSTRRQAGRGGTRAARRELKSAHPAVDGCIKEIRSALNASHWNDNVRRDFERSLENIANLAKQIPAASEESQKCSIAKRCSSTNTSSVRRATS